MFFIAGDPSWQKNIPSRPVFDWWLAIPFCIGLLLAVRWMRRPARQLAPHLSGREPVQEGTDLFPSMWLLVALLITLLPGFLARPAPHFSRTIGSAPFAYIVLGLGIVGSIRWLAREHKWRWRGGAAIGLGLLAALALNTFNAYFGQWPRNDGTLHDFEYGQVTDANYLNAQRTSPGSTVFFLGEASGTPIRYLSPRFKQSPWMEDFSQMVPLPSSLPALYVFAAPSLPANPSEPSVLQRYFPAAQMVAQADFLNGDQAGRVYRVDAEQLSSFQGIARPIGSTFRNELELEQANVPQEISVQPGQEVRIGLTWKVLAPSARNYAAFIHVVDSSGRVVAQDDRQAMQAFGWMPGERVLSLHLITLPKDAPAGRYRVLAGMDERTTDKQPSQSLGQLAAPVKLATLISR
jgi:hypothetical protein